MENVVVPVRLWGRPHDTFSIPCLSMSLVSFVFDRRDGVVISPLLPLSPFTSKALCSRWRGFDGKDFSDWSCASWTSDVGVNDVYCNFFGIGVWHNSAETIHGFEVKRKEGKTGGSLYMLGFVAQTI